MLVLNNRPENFAGMGPLVDAAVALAHRLGSQLDANPGPYSLGSFAGGETKSSGGSPKPRGPSLDL